MQVMFLKIFTVCVLQKKSPETPAAEYKKTDEAQPDVKEEEEEDEEEEDKAEEKSSPGIYDGWIQRNTTHLSVTVSLTFKSFFLAAAEENGEEIPAEDEEEDAGKEATADEVKRDRSLIWA